jgi:hypothetical protein
MGKTSSGRESYLILVYLSLMMRDFKKFEKENDNVKE